MRPPTDADIPDATIPDAGPAPVTVSVRKVTGEPVTGATVVFGACNVPSGAMVTVALGTADAPRLVTITAIEPGDLIVVSDFGSDTNLTTVSLPAEPDGGAGTYSYRLSSGGCSTFFFVGGTPPLTNDVHPECIGPNRKFPVMLETNDDSNVPTAFQFKKGNDAPPDGGTVTPTLGAFSTTFNTQTVNGSNVVDGGGNIAVGYGEIADGVMNKSGANIIGLDPSGGVTTSFEGHGGFPDAVQYEVAAHVFPVGAGDGLVGAAVRKAPPAGDDTTNIDFTGHLPEITNAGVDAGTPKRPAISWTPAASLAAADGTYVIVRWYEAGDAGQISGTWSFVTPGAVTSITAPALPANLALAPGAAADYTSSGLPRVISVEASFVNGYGELRKGAGVLAPRRELIENNERCSYRRCRSTAPSSSPRSR
jgi:hypothetical protein